MLDSNTIIIILLIFLIILFLWDMNRREPFFGGSDYEPVNYNKRGQPCDNLTGSNPCVVDTVIPSKKIVCNKNLDPVDTNSCPKPKSKKNAKTNMYSCIENVDMGLSMDELDQMSMDQMNMEQMNVDKVRKQQINLEQQFLNQSNVDADNINQNNLEIKNTTNNKYDNNTLSDIDRELVSFN